MVDTGASGKKITFIDFSRTASGNLTHAFRQLLNNPYLCAPWVSGTIAFCMQEVLKSTSTYLKLTNGVP